MDKVGSISWHYLPGNKYTKALHSAMDSDAGYTALQRVRKKGQDRGSMYNVIYERDYLLEILVRKIVEPLSSLGKERIIELIELAWDSYFKSPLAPSESSEDNG